MKTRTLSLLDCYLLQVVGSVATTLAGSCGYFWTMARWNYSGGENLLLGACVGFVYVIFSVLGGIAADRYGREKMIATAFVGGAAMLLLLLCWNWRYAPFVMLPAWMCFVAFAWPALESGMNHAPSSMSMPQRMGTYNVTWSFGNAFALVAGGWLFKTSVDLIMWVSILVYAAGAAWLLAGRFLTEARAGASALDVPHKGDSVDSGTKRRFLFMAWLGNAMAYFMLSGFNAVAPYMAGPLNVAVHVAIWLIAVLYVGRALAFVALWKWEGWHYRMGLGLIAFWGAPACLAVVFFVPFLPLVCAALFGMGVLMGLTYSKSLYYSMDYGEAGGEHGGYHEAILGSGSLLGPLAGACGIFLVGTLSGVGAFIVGATILIKACGSALILKGRENIEHSTSNIQC